MSGPARPTAADALARASRGYRPLYQSGSRCPACAGRHWWRGRKSAECVRCGAALPLAPEEMGAARA